MPNNGTGLLSLLPFFFLLRASWPGLTSGLSIRSSASSALAQDAENPGTVRWKLLAFLPEPCCFPPGSSRPSLLRCRMLLTSRYKTVLPETVLPELRPGIVWLALLAGSWPGPTKWIQCQRVSVNSALAHALRLLAAGQNQSRGLHVSKPLQD